MLDIKDCELIKIHSRKTRGYGSKLTFKSKISEREFVVKVDQDLEYIRDKMQEHLENRNRHNIIDLTYGECTLGLNTANQEWFIYQEKELIYKFNKTDAETIIKKSFVN